MNEIHSIHPIYPVNMPNKFIKGRTKEPAKKNQPEQEKNDEEEAIESTVQHIDKTV